MLKTVILVAAKIEEVDFGSQVIDEILDFKENEFPKYEWVLLEQLDY